MKRFLENGDNLQQSDTAQILHQIQNLRLPFERLVRNVWTEGPEVSYDRIRATLTRMLQQDIAQRKAVATRIASEPPQQTAPDTLSPRTASRMLRTEMGSVSHREGPCGVRVGLLHFYGAASPRRKA